MTPEQQFTQLKDADRWAGPRFVFDPGVPQRRRSIWRQATVAIIAGLAVGVLAVVGLTFARPEVPVAPPAATPDAEFSQTPGVPDSLDGYSQSAPIAVWDADGTTIHIVLWGSSTCPDQPADLTSDTTHIRPTIGVTFTPTDSQECTADLAPTTTSFSAPGGINPDSNARIEMALPHGAPVTVKINPPIREDPEHNPGETLTTPLSDPITQEFIGTQVVELGDRPSGSNGISYRLSCLSTGMFGFGENGGSMSCDEGDIRENSGVGEIVVELQPGEDSYKIVAGADDEWRIETTWLETHVTEWGVNANGDTYGIVNENGEPDLMSTYATNGKVGYTYSSEHENPGSCGAPDLDADEYRACLKEHEDEVPTINVYESDGETVIGTFEFSTGSGIEILPEDD